MNKYQRAIGGLKEGRTWKQVGDILTEGWRQALAKETDDVVWPADAWNVYEGKSNSCKVETALETLGLVSMPGPRHRQHAEFPDEETMQEFKDFYGIHGPSTFTHWVISKWEMDKDPHIFRMEDLQ